jgi:hypothetical protein
MARRRPDVPLTPPPCPPGWRTGPPDFVGIGTQRSGTSWWYRYAIATHPRYQPMGDLPKELHYFDRFWDAEANGEFVERYHALFPRPEGAFTGEWTPRYMADFWPMRLLRQAAPDARILVMLRDPVDRYRSAIAREKALAEDEDRRMDLAVGLAIVSDAVWRGYYGEQLRHVFEVFPRDQVLVLQYERCRRDPVDQLEATCRFLGIEVPDEPSELLLRQPRRGGHERPELPDRVRDDLVTRYRDDVAALVELCPEIDLSLWPNFANG